MLQTIGAYYSTEQVENDDWVYGNTRDGRDIETTLASSPVASPGPSEVTIFLPEEELSFTLSQDPIETVDRNDVLDRLMYSDPE